MSDNADRPATMTGAWSRMTGRVLRGAVAANTAAIEAWTGAADGAEPTDPGRVRAGREWRPDRPLADGRGPGVSAVAYEESGWTTERSVDRQGAIAVGDYVAFSKTLTDGDVRSFAAVSGDTNRLHLDDPFAERTRFGGRIVHGTLVSGLISAALARLPGLTIYISQDLEFTAPVRIGNRVRARVEVVEALGGDRYRLSTTVEDADADRVAVDGEAVVLVDEAPGEGADGAATGDGAETDDAAAADDPGAGEDGGANDDAGANGDGGPADAGGTADASEGADGGT